MNSKSLNQTYKKVSLQEQIGNTIKQKNNNKKQIQPQKEIRSEFQIRQKEYEELYKFPNSQSEKLVNISERKDPQQSKFRTIINDAKLRYTKSNSQQNQYYIEKQQSAMKLIVEQLRNQRRLQGKVNQNKTKNTKQINLNWILLLSIPILCLFVLLLELYKQDKTII